MTGFSGTSHTEKFYQYYGCVTQRRKGGCKKKSVSKGYIEDLVVNKVLSVLNDEYIDTIAQKIADLSAKESNTDTTKRLKRLLKENEDATANLIKAIETGKAVDVLSAQIEKRQAQRADLETQLAREKMIRPTLTFEEIKFFFEKFKNGDANDASFRSALIDTFVNRIYLYDGNDARIEIYCNANEHKINCPIDKPVKGSSIGQLVPLTGRYLNHLKTALSHRAAIFKKNPNDAEPSSTLIQEDHPFGSDVKMVRQHKLTLKLLTPEEKNEVVNKYRCGMTMTAIADEYGCHYTTVGRLLRSKGGRDSKLKTYLTHSTII